MQFYLEVEKEVQKFRESLHSKLLQMPSPLEEKKKIIRHLVDLEYAGTSSLYITMWLGVVCSLCSLITVENNFVLF